MSPLSASASYGFVHLSPLLKAGQNRDSLLHKMQRLVEVRWASYPRRALFALNNEHLDRITGKSAQSFVTKYRIDPIHKFRTGTYIYYLGKLV
jgi:hypothetical protein